MLGFTVMAVELVPKRTIRRKVEERAVTGLCLHCDRQAERLGLCNHHYYRYRMTLLQQPARERELWKARQVREGRVLVSHQRQRLRNLNPFDEED